MGKIKITSVDLVSEKEGFIYQFEASESLKGIKQGIIINAIEAAVNNPKSEKDLYNEQHEKKKPYDPKMGPANPPIIEGDIEVA